MTNSRSLNESSASSSISAPSSAPAVPALVSVPSLLDIAISQLSVKNLSDPRLNSPELDSYETGLIEQALDIFEAKLKNYEATIRTLILFATENNKAKTEELLQSLQGLLPTRSQASEYPEALFAQDYLSFLKNLSSVEIVNEDVFKMVLGYLPPEDSAYLNKERAISSAKRGEWFFVIVFLQQQKQYHDKAILTQLLDIAVEQHFVNPTPYKKNKNRIAELLRLGVDPTALALQYYRLGYFDDEDGILIELAVHANADHTMIQQAFLKAKTDREWQFIRKYLKLLNKDKFIPSLLDHLLLHAIYNTNPKFTLSLIDCGIIATASHIDAIFELRIQNRDAQSAMAFAMHPNANARSIQTTFLTAETNAEWFFIREYLSKIDKNKFDSAILEKVLLRAIRKTKPEFMQSLIRCGITITAAHIEEAFEARLPKSLEILLQEEQPERIHTATLLKSWLRGTESDWKCVEVYLNLRSPSISILSQILSTILTNPKQHANNSLYAKHEHNWIMRLLNKFDKSQFDPALLEQLLLYAIQVRHSLVIALINYGIPVTLAHVTASFQCEMPDSESEHVLISADKNIAYKTMLIEAAKRGKQHDWRIIHSCLYFRWPDDDTVEILLTSVVAHQNQFLDACHSPPIADQYHPKFMRKLFMYTKKSHAIFASYLAFRGLQITEEDIEFAFASECAYMMQNLLKANFNVRNDKALLEFSEKNKGISYNAKTYLDCRSLDKETARKLWLILYKHKDVQYSSRLVGDYGYGIGIADHTLFFTANTKEDWMYIKDYMSELQDYPFGVMKEGVFHCCSFTDMLGEHFLKMFLLHVILNLSAANIEFCIFLITECSSPITEEHVEAALRSQSIRVLQELLSGTTIEHNAALLDEARRNNWPIVNAYLEIRTPNEMVLKSLFHHAIEGKNPETAAKILTFGGMVAGTRIAHAWKNANPDALRDTFQGALTRFHNQAIRQEARPYFYTYGLSYHQEDLYSKEDVRALFIKWISEIKDGLSKLSQHSDKGKIFQDFINYNKRFYQVMNKDDLIGKLRDVIHLALQKDRFSLFSNTSSGGKVETLLQQSEYKVFSDLILGPHDTRVICYDDLRNFVFGDNCENHSKPACRYQAYQNISESLQYRPHNFLNCY